MIVMVVLITPRMGVLGVIIIPRGMGMGMVMVMGMCIVLYPVDSSAVTCFVSW